ncbi:MAG: hypothetical protein PVG99_10220 [Desulfobacteraceae bacterium]|jgi:hypothetical protein
MNFQELQTLIRLGSILQWVVIILIFLAGSIQISKFFMDRKIQNMREEIEEDRTARYEQMISKLKKRVSQQMERVEVVLEREKGRTIPEHLFSQVTEELSKYEGTSIRLNCVQGDKEALAFSKELKEIFQGAGWRVSGVNQVPYGSPIDNIVIVLNSTTQKPKANYIFSLFRALRYKSTARLNKNQREDLGILVGKRE